MPAFEKRGAKESIDDIEDDCECVEGTHVALLVLRAGINSGIFQLMMGLLIRRSTTDTDPFEDIASKRSC